MKKYAIFLILSVLLFSGCVDDIDPFEKGNPDAVYKVLIAGVSSAFKDAVIKSVIEKLGTDSYYVKGIGLSEFEKADLTEYDAVLVVCMMKGGVIDDHIRNYFTDDPANGKLAVLFTTGLPLESSKNPDWVLSGQSVDAISSASEMNTVEERAEELAILIKKRCGGNE